MTCDLFRGRVLLVAGYLSVAGCGEAMPVIPISTSPQGIWRLSQGAVSESSLHLASDGLFSRVVTDLSGGTCASSSGSWRTDGETLLLTVTTLSNAPASGVESYRFVIENGYLKLDGSETFAPIDSMVSCADYGFGDWIGSLRASVKGVEVVFEIADVFVDTYGGQLQIDGLSSTGSDQSRMLLRIDGSPEPLATGVFTVQNVPGATDTFYGLYDPEPGSSTFSGFDTTRLSPSGTFTLSAVSPEHVTATFSFRANPRVEGEVGPDGATFAQIESGLIDIVYR